MHRLVPHSTLLRTLAAGDPQGFRSRHPTRQLGQGAVEFLAAAAPLLLLALGSIEFIHWYFVRQAISLALVQAGRAAITQHANPAVLDSAFTSALLPLHAGPTPAVSQARLARAIYRREAATGLPAWQIRIISPSVASFADFASTNPELGGGGRPAIDNDYLQEQHLSRLAQGWPQGRGPQSGQTTLEANTLQLKLTWLHEPLLPGMKQLLKQLAPADTRYGSRAMASAGFLPIHRQVALVMQSHAVNWDTPAHGRVVRNTALNEPTSPDTNVNPPGEVGSYSEQTAADSGNASANGGSASGDTGQAGDGAVRVVEDGQAVNESGGPADVYLDPDAAAPADDCPGCCD